MSTSPSTTSGVYTSSKNIANSETSHTEAVRNLLTTCNLLDPASSAIGIFTNPDLQALYKQLVAEGSQSLAAALYIGVTIEDLDIVDLQNSLAQTEQSDIITVYQNLMRGSSNHLRAFVSTLEQQTGESYQPQYLDQTTCNDIINSSNEKGQRLVSPTNRPGNGPRWNQ